MGMKNERHEDRVFPDRKLRDNLYGALSIDAIDTRVTPAKKRDLLTAIVINRLTGLSALVDQNCFPCVHCFSR